MRVYDVSVRMATECYQRCIVGWIREIFVSAEGERRLLTAKVLIATSVSVRHNDLTSLCLSTYKVNPSQRMREKPLLPWVIFETSGEVLACHCNCMAGLGETCSHVASLLLRPAFEEETPMTVTQKKGYLVLPHSVKEVPYVPLSHINFVGHAGSLAALTSPSPMTLPSPSQPSSSCSSVLSLSSAGEVK